MNKHSRRVFVFVALAASAVLAGTGMAGTAGAAAPSSTEAVSPAGHIIDPDKQIAEARAAQSRSAGTWAGAPDPGGKAASPATKLGAYPKFTDQQLAERTAQDHLRAEASSSASDAGEVLTVETSSSGGTNVTIYSPAPDVGPEKLADMLRKQGKKDVRVVRHDDHAPSGKATVQAPGDCTYGSARSFSCPVAYWTNNGFADPLVRFNDHSGADWPTTNAVYKWNQTPNIDSAYRWNSCPFLAGARCVDVYSGNYGAGWTGRVSGFFPGSATSGPFRENGQYIQLNDYYTPSGWTRNNTVTHEMGHTLGLGHNVWSGDVMYRIANMREDIGGQNPALLVSIYSITR